MIKLFLLNNVRREEVGQVSYHEILSQNDVESALLQKFQELDCVMQLQRGSLHIMQENELIPFDENLLISDNVTVVYLDVVKADNEHEFKVNGKREGKIVYYLNSREERHFFEPHIHARIGHYKDKGCEKIRISLKNFETDGKFKRPDDQKEAIEFVKKNIDELREFWNSIIVPLGGPKWED